MRVLEYFIKNPTKRSYAAKLLREVVMARKNLFDALHCFEKDGLLLSAKTGRAVEYSLNRESPIVKQLKILYSVNDVLPLLKKIGDAGEAVYLFGSAARGEDVEDSDIDVLIISNIEKDKVMSKLKTIGIRLKPLILTSLEYSQLGRKDRAFYERIGKDKIRLI